MNEQEPKPRRGRPPGAKALNPKIELTEKIVKNLPTPPTGQTEYRDSKVAGLSVRVSHQGTKSYYLKYYLNGKQRRMHLGTACGPSGSQFRYEDAKAQAHLAWRKIKLEIDPATEKAALASAATAARREPTWADLCERYMKEKAAMRCGRARTLKEKRASIDNRLLPAWGTLKAREVDRAMVRELIGSVRVEERIVRGKKVVGKNVAANRLLTLIRAILNFGVHEGVLSVNPSEGIDPTKESHAERFLSSAEIEAVWPHFSGPLRVALLTGQRKSEVERMPWKELTEDGRAWLLPGARAKNKRANLIPLVGEAARIIHAQPRSRERVFPIGVRGSFDRARKASGIVEHFTINALRHTLITGLSEMGVAPHVVSAVVNHSPKSITARVYNQYEWAAEKRAALLLWDKRIARIVSGEKATVTDIASARGSA
jgi:integrase